MARIQLRTIHSLHSFITRFALTVPLALATGCLLSTSPDPASNAGLEPKKEDERRIWLDAEVFDQRIREAGGLYEDEALEDYLDGLAGKLLAHLGAPGLPIRVRVLPDPYLNAFAMANGSIYLHSGLVAATENEAQLAFVLAHELAHILRRHTLKIHRTAKNDPVVGGFLGVEHTDKPAPYADYLRDVQTSGYSRDLEREADLDALNGFGRAGYPLREAPRIFEELMQQAEQIEQPYFLGSHPRLAERLDVALRYLDLHPDALSDPGAEGRPADPAYEEMIEGLLLENARLNLEMGYTRKSRQDVERHLAVRPDSIEGHLLLGRLHKSRMSDHEHRDAAIAAYRNVVRIDDDHAEGHRELGLMLRGAQRWSEAARSLERYLEITPGAVDRQIIEAYLRQPATTR